MQIASQWVSMSYVKSVALITGMNSTAQTALSLRAHRRTRKAWENYCKLEKGRQPHPDTTACTSKPCGCKHKQNLFLEASFKQLPVLTLSITYSALLQPQGNAGLLAAM